MIFSLTAFQEAKRKQVFGAHQQEDSAQFFQILIDDTNEIAKKSGLDVVWIDEKKQKGKDFASRYTHAFQDLFDQGYEQVISIGNDCPNLQLTHLNNAVQKLQQNNLVLGPAHDGGVYLLGISKKAFDRATFCKFSWQKATLYQEIKNWANKAELPTFSFELLNDLDTLQDVITFSEENPTCFLGIFITQTLYRFFKIFNPSCVGVTAQQSCSKTPPRAPPISFLL